LLGGAYGVAARALEPKDRYFLNRYERFHFFGSHSPREGRPGLDATDATALRELADFMEKPGKACIRLFHGTQWVVLTPQDVEAILAAQADTQLRRSFIYSLIPDESYFQTILGMREGFVRGAESVYVDWSARPGPRCFAEPAETIDALWSSRLFLRKVAPDAHAVVDFLADECAMPSMPIPHAGGTPRDGMERESVTARHPHWAAELHLEPGSGRLLHSTLGTAGSYRLAEGRLEVFWDHYPPEVFTLRDGIYVHGSLLEGAPRAAARR
jgi:hypothetical protein